MTAGEEGQAPNQALYSILCPNPNCRVRNFVYDETNNICFNCGGILFLNQEAREARWYEEAGRAAAAHAETGVWIGLAMCVVAFLGVPLVVGSIARIRLAKELQAKGEEMNRAAGRPKLARGTRHFGGLSGGEYWVKRSPDPDDRPGDGAFREPDWLPIFRRVYYLTWVAAVIGILVAF